MHFLPNPDNLPEVNHIDLNRRNNIVTNLQWITQYNNELHAIHTRIAQGRIKSGNTLTPEAIRDIRFLSKQGRSHVSIAKMFGVSDAHICNIVSGKRWFHLV
jgi:hypothetical protein